jgi:hypothetical protein
MFNWMQSLNLRHPERHQARFSDEEFVIADKLSLWQDEKSWSYWPWADKMWMQ